jgi:hypothetical protein
VKQKKRIQSDSLLNLKALEVVRGMAKASPAGIRMVAAKTANIREHYNLNEGDIGKLSDL